MAIEYHVLNLGAGVQSTTVALLDAFDAAVFADTQEEPKAVYNHLDWLDAALSYPVYRRTIGRLGDDLLGVSQKSRFASIPAFTGTSSRTGGVTRRHCSREYKSDVVTRTIRREIVGLAKGRRLPKGIEVHQYFGISRDEAIRSVRIKERVESIKGWYAHFPLLDKGWTRGDCLRFLAERVPHKVPRSACIFCPYHSDDEWYAIKAAAWSVDVHAQAEWQRVVFLDYALRDPKTLARRGLREPLYLHPSRQPIDTVDFRSQNSFPSFVRECEGVCGV